MLEKALQLVANGLMAGSVLALPAIGLTLIFAVLRFPNFALAAHLAIGAYAGYVANVRFGAPLPVALLAAFLWAGLCGAATQHGVLRSFANAGSLGVAIASIALNLILENGLRFVFGNDLRGYDLPIRRDVLFGPVRIGPQQAEDAAFALAAMTLVFLFLRFTRAGKEMRAVADDPDLADIKGINPLRVAAIASFAGMGLAGAGGVLIGIDTAVEPLVGFRVLLSVFAAAVLGGLGSIPGAALGAFAIGIAEELSVLVVAPTYRSAVGFLTILLVLTFRPSGLLGARIGR